MVSEPPPSDVWVVRHVAYGTLAARRRIVLELHACCAPASWWWADVATTQPLLELARRAPVADWTVGSNAGSLALGAQLFAAAADRAAYAELLARTAPAAAAKLRSSPSAGTALPWPVVSEELSRVYERHLPADMPLRTALSWHAAWLTGIIDGSPQPAVPGMTPLAALVIRAAHVQVVRLRGPEYAGDLQGEVDAVRELGRSYPCDVTPG